MSSLPPRQDAVSRFALPVFTLRRKTALALALLALIIAAVTASIGAGVIERLSVSLGSMLVRTQANLTRERIAGTLNRELALVERMAGSTLFREWLAAEDDPRLRERALEEGEDYRKLFTDRSFFLVSAGSGHYYYADAQAPGQAVVRYTVRAGNPDDAWFFSTLKKRRTLNVDYDRQLGVTKVWINQVMFDRAGQPNAVMGTGLDLTRFLSDLLAAIEPGITVMIVDGRGTIVAHPDRSLMAFATVANAESDKTLWRLLDADTDHEQIRTYLEEGQSAAGALPVLHARMNGVTHMLSLAPVAELGWWVVSAVDASPAALVGRDLIVQIAWGGLLIVATIFVLVSYGFDRLVLRPLVRLTDAVRRLGEGSLSEPISSRRHDELGELTRSFADMAARVQAHTGQLEREVESRTEQLRTALSDLGSAHVRLTDSIRYASLIQQVILPERDLAERLAGEYFVLWQPRDVVGGDFYLFRSGAGGYLFGIIDCAGHGVPGAFMTMIAHAAIEAALVDDASSDPASILLRIDQGVRRMLPHSGRLERLATSMDIGLIHVVPGNDYLSFCGAGIDLFVADDAGVREIRGQRFGINDRRSLPLETVRVPHGVGATFYLATDGLLDQSGGARGHAFGRQRFIDWIRHNAGVTLELQRQSLAEVLEQYRGEHAVRDDVTVLAYRAAPPASVQIASSVQGETQQ